MNKMDLCASAQTWLTETSGDFNVFKAQATAITAPSDVPHASDIQKNIPIYRGSNLKEAAVHSCRREAILKEWTNVFLNGAGIIVIKNAIADMDVIDEASDIFANIIKLEKSGSAGGGDHFAKSGSNDRVWNAIQKHCLSDPDNFVKYYSCEAIAMGAEAWLGRGYQVTAQVNRVNPGGAAQKPHRDYHLGFMLPAQTLNYPTHVHATSAFLTLQGAVAHCDMPIESGPTQLLPFSQKFTEGYLAFSRDEFQSYFSENYIQLELSKGDVVFFNPAIMHAAGENVSSDIYRMVNLLQISSAFGRAMENIDRFEMSKSIYPTLLKYKQAQLLNDNELRNAIQACAEGYAFPTNLDMDPPIGGMAPKSQADYVLEAMNRAMAKEDLVEKLTALRERQAP